MRSTQRLPCDCQNMRLFQILLRGTLGGQLAADESSWSLPLRALGGEACAWDMWRTRGQRDGTGVTWLKSSSSTSAHGFSITRARAGARSGRRGAARTCAHSVA